jgi:protein ImuB
MAKRFMCIWFRHLMTDWMTLRRPELKDIAFVFGTPDHGRIVIVAVNPVAELQGIHPGMAAADAKAIIPGLQVIDDIPDPSKKLLKAIGEWCIRYTPVIATNLPDGLILDISGCAHLWGGEREYLKHVVNTLRNKGYDVRAAIADTIGAAWAIAHYGRTTPIIEPGQHIDALLPLHPSCLRLEKPVIDRLQKLGLTTIKKFISMPSSALRRRFGAGLLLRLNQALGNEEEYMSSLYPWILTMNGYLALSR